MLKFLSKEKKTKVNGGKSANEADIQELKEIPSSDLKSQFEDAVKRVKNRDVQLNKDQYLRLYGLFKQMNVGNNDTKIPSVLKVIDRQKWSAWDAARGMSAAEAMQEYINIAVGKKTKISEKENAGQAVKTPSLSEDNFTPSDLREKNSDKSEAVILLSGKKIPKGNPIIFKFKVIGDSSVSQETVVKLVPGKTKYALPFRLDFIGRPYALRCSISSETTKGGEWHLDQIELYFKEIDTRFHFNHYSNIQLPCPEIIFFESSGWLPQNEPETVRKVRLIERGILEKRYQWAYHSDGEHPGFGDFSEYSSLPEDEHFSEKGYMMNLPEYYGEKEAEMTPPESFDFYVDNVKEIKRIPRVAKADLWKDDAEFGRAYLQGPHSNFIKQCSELPENLNLNENFEVKIAQKTLGTLMTEGLVFIADYKILEGVTTHEDRYIAAPIVLLLSRPESEEFLPIAIQLVQTKKENPPVFCPEDSPEDWLFAKMWARLADGAYNQIVAHFLLTHGVSEAISVSAYRTLSSSHPVLQLLRPHLKHSLATGVLARNTLLNPGGWVDQFMSFGGAVQKKMIEEAYRKVSLKDYMNLPRDLKKRKVENTKKLPNYPFRDDGILIWNAIHAYTESVLKIYYHSDDDVKNDFLIRDWLGEFNSKGYRYSDFPNAFETLNELIEFITSLIWTFSALHGSMNFIQYEVYGFVPFAPAILHSPPPTEKGTITERDILNALPGKKIAGGLLAVINWLSTHFEEDIHLGMDDRLFSSNPESRFAQLKFRNELKKIEQEIEHRNNLRSVPYPVFLPSQILNSVGI